MLLGLRLTVGVSFSHFVAVIFAENSCWRRELGAVKRRQYEERACTGK